MLKESILKFLKLDSLVHNLTGYIESRIELTKLELKEDFIKVLSKASVYLVTFIVFIMFLFFLSMALAFKLAEFTGTFGGFAIVAGIYVILGITLVASKENISKKLEKEFKEVMKQKQK